MLMQQMRHLHRERPPCYEWKSGIQTQVFSTPNKSSNGERFHAFLTIRCELNSLHPIVYTHLCSKGEKDIWQMSPHPDFHRIFLRLQLWVRRTWEWCYKSCLLLGGDTDTSLLHGEMWLWNAPIQYHSDLWKLSSRPAPSRVPYREEARDKCLWNKHCI